MTNETMTNGKMKNKKVVVAMSGGVDSSVTAALLAEQGYNVIGITMQVWPIKHEFGGCCSLSAVEDARKVANILNIPHYVLNFREEFKEKVIDNFISEYKEGRTPNPCIRCNQFIKFNLLLRKAKELGADYIATGHYARIKSQIPNHKLQTNYKLQITNYKLLKGIDPRKDQSYVLYVMNQESLSRTLMPIGELTKEEVRRLAKRFNLGVAEKEESQEICFIEEGDYAEFLKKVIPEAVKPGSILDIDGNIIGMHGGILFYTIGQRRGIGAHGRKTYVVAIDRARNALIVGGKEDVFCDELVAKDVNWILGEAVKKGKRVKAKIRYTDPEADATLYPLEKGQVRVKFKEPQKAITPGQSVVFYEGNVILGGGIIDERIKR